MDKYIGTKLISASKKTYGEYRKIKYGDNQFESNLTDDTSGYMVQYSDDYISWSPADVFEAAYKKINGYLTMLQHDLTTIDNTKILKDEITFNAPHNYIIQKFDDDTILAGIHFQEGPTKENNLNGIFMEDLIAICINRLENFQKSEFSCRENAVVITKLEESLMWLRKRTINRQNRNVLGTYEK